MIQDEKHDQRMCQISESADKVHDSALDLVASVQRLLSSTGRNSNKNMLLLEQAIRKNKNG